MMRSFIEQNLTISQKTNLQWSESPKFHMDEMLHTSQAVITTNTVSFNRHGRQILVMQVNAGLLLGSAHPLKEGDEGHESVIILGLTELLHESLGLLLGPWSPCRPCTWGTRQPWRGSSGPSPRCLRSP